MSYTFRVINGPHRTVDKIYEVGSTIVSDSDLRLNFANKFDLIPDAVPVVVPVVVSEIPSVVEPSAEYVGLSWKQRKAKARGEVI